MILVLGEPKLDVQEMYAGEELVFGTLEDVPNLVYCMSSEEAGMLLLRFVNAGNTIYVAEAQTGIVRTAMRSCVTDGIVDEAMLILQKQATGNEINSADELFDALMDSLDNIVLDVEYEDTETIRFGEAGKGQCVVKFTERDGVYVNNNPLRRSVITGEGHFAKAILGNKIMTEGEILRFIVNRVAVNGTRELAGYGRAFGPDTADASKANATLAGRSKKFRRAGVTGVVTATLAEVNKAKADTVSDVAVALREITSKKALGTVMRLVKEKITGESNNLLKRTDCEDVLESIVTMHQMAKELYCGREAAEAFRMVVWLDEQGTLMLKAFGKSSKHWRVDAGAFCLYTANGDGFIELDAVLGQFEESNDGSVYAPLALMERDMRGYLKETVEVKKDFKHMSEEARLKYMLCEVTVKVGDKITPGDTVIKTVDKTVEWSSKADYGIVRNIVEDPGNELNPVSTYRVEIEAWFEGDAKIRGFGKGLVCPMEAAGITLTVSTGGHRDTTERVLIGVPGIVKDSAAAKEYILSQEPCRATVTTQHNAESFEFMMRKHMPDEDAVDGVTRKSYPNGVTVTFDESALTIATFDPNAIAARIKVVIEAAPVAQAVGSSSLTMPQANFIASFETGNKWLNRFLLPKVKRRVNILTYYHAVAGNIDMNPDHVAEVNTEDDEDLVMNF